MKNKLLEFYFGTLPESDRLQMEQILLVDSEALVNYLDLKRAIESAGAVPDQPSSFVWQNLQSKLKVKKQIFIPFVFGAAAAVIVLFLWTFNMTSPVIHDQKPEDRSTTLIFDSSRELPASSSVL